MDSGLEILSLFSVSLSLFFLPLVSHSRVISPCVSPSHVCLPAIDMQAQYAMAMIAVVAMVLVVMVLHSRLESSLTNGTLSINFVDQRTP